MSRSTQLDVDLLDAIEAEIAARGFSRIAQLRPSPQFRRSERTRARVIIVSCR
jgi:hypothetical protein